MTKAILKPFEVSEDEVGRLAPIELVQLIKRLIQADLQLCGVPLLAIQGTLKINVSDGGEDIRVEWNSPSNTAGPALHYLTVFQLKAENLTDSKLKKEPVEANGKRLKASVAEVVDRGGTYVIVTSKTNLITPKRGKEIKVPRLTEMRGLLRSSIGKFNPRADRTNLDIYGPTKIAEWVNTHPMVAIWMKQLLGLASADFAFQTLEDWSKYRDLSNAHVSWPTLNGQQRAIQELLLKPREVVRLLGHAGLGKSRLAFEALQSPANDPADDLAPIVAYARTYSPDLINQVRDFIKNRRRVVLVIDECPPDGHRQLSHEVHRSDSMLSMITLDLEFDKPPPEDLEIVVEEAPHEAIKEILRTSGAILPPEDLERATEFCSGFPLIAVLVAAGLRGGAEHFADFQDPENITSKLVWGRGSIDADLLRCLRCIALFEAVGVAEPKDVQLKWIAENLLEMSAGQLEANLEHFYHRRILQRRGYSILVRPRPLAAQLAASFWRNATGSQRKCLLDGSMPDELKQALCDRLSDLDYLTDARAVAAQLCSQSGPFGSAKALNTDIGARCLRRLAEVAPVDVIEALEREFGSLDLATLKQTVGPGRRWLVWTLDALSWEPSTFQQTMRLLLRFAAAENETWANNATAEFTQRFRIQLPGTSANLVQRLASLSALVEGAEESELPVLVASLASAIDAHGGTRTIGSENHGTRKTYEDYQPKLWAEIFDYVRGVLRLLKKISLRSAEALKMVRDAFAAVEPSLLISEPSFGEYKALVEHLKPEGETWGKLLEQLSWQLKHRLTDEDAKDVREKVGQLFASLLPQSLEERILFFVKSVPYNFSEPDSPEYDFEQNRRRAAELGRECAENWSVFERVVGPLSQGETRESFAFGSSFLEATDRPSEAIETAVRELEGSQIPNQSLLGGMIFALFKGEKKALEQLLERVARTPKLVRFLPYFAALNLTTDGLNLVIGSIDRGDLSPELANIFGMGRVLDPLPLQDVKRLMKTLISQGAGGAWVAVDLLSMYLHSDLTKLSDVREEVDRALRSAPLVSDKSDRTMESHHYETLVKGLLGDAIFGAGLAEFLAGELVKAAQDYGSTASARLPQRLVELILTKYPTIILPIFASWIEKADRKDRWYFSRLLGTPFSFNEKREGPLFRLGYETVLAACRAYPKNFAVMVTEVAPLFSYTDGQKCWSDVGKALLDEFGTRQEILNALSINIGTGGWTGPSSAHLRTFLPPLEQVKDHPTRQVRLWAREKLKQFRAQIDREVRDEEEQSLRRG